MPADIIDVTTGIDSQWWVRAAQGAVRRYCGWHVAPSVAETLRLDGYGGRVLTLPSKHITAIASVIVGDEDWRDRCDWSEAGTVLLRSGRWPDAPGAIRVGLTHGWASDEVPEVAALILTLSLIHI